MLVLAIWTILSLMARISAHKAAPFLVVVLFLETGCLIGIVLVLSLVLGFLLEMEILLLHQIDARISLVSLHTCVLCLAFSSTSRDPIRSATLNSCLLYCREVAKSFQECGSLAIIHPATNLSGNTHGKFSSSFASD